MFCKDLKRFSFIVVSFLVIELNATAQITTAENGLYTPIPSTIRLGGPLSQSTYIDLGNNYNFHFINGTKSIFSILNNGNVGIGTPVPGARLSFPGVEDSEDPVGITWYSPAPTAYGIHRTAGSWVGPNYQQLRMSFNTGIILDPGTDYGKSYVDIVGNGLRVSQGNVGIGTTDPHALLSLGNSTSNAKLAIWEGVYGGQILRSGLGVANNQFRFFIPNLNSRYSFLSDEAGTNEVMTIQGTGNVGIGTTDPHALLSLGNSISNSKLAIWEGFYGGQILRSGFGIANGQFRIFIPASNNRFSFLSAEDATSELMTIQGTGNVGIGTSNPQSRFHLVTSTADATATDFRITDNNGDAILSARNDQIVSVGSGTHNAQLVIGGTGAYSGIYSPSYGSTASNIISYKDYNGNVRMTLDMSNGTDGKLGIGNTTPHCKLEVGTSPDDDQSPYTSSIWDTYSTRFNNGNISIFSAGSFNTTGSSYQLSFYSRYWDGGQGAITNKSAYIKGTSTTDRNNPQNMWMGRGTLVLGSTNTNYYPTGFTDVPAMYLSNGQVGIGVSTPEAQLHTNGTVKFAGLTNDNAKDRVIVSDANGNLAYRDAATLGGSGTAGWGFGGNSVATSSALGTTSNFDLPIITNNTEQMRIGANGNVGIGTTSIANYKLSVNGNIRTRKVRVDQDTWADYVFENNYQLRPINELEQYIQTEKHLPDVPSAAEVKKEGLDLGDNQAVLLKKIEELTLYVIEQNKKIEALQKLVLQQQSEKEAQEKERNKGSK